MHELHIQSGSRITSAHLFAGVFLASCAAAVLLIGSFPLTASIVTIFVFAGPHNAMEFRYFLARMPRHWGRSRSYYLTAIVGVLLLTGGYLAIYFAAGNWLWSAEGWTAVVASWNTLLLAWLGILVYMRGRQRPRSDWSWAFAGVALLAAAAWAMPEYWSLALVYLHPLIAFWFLDRQIGRSRPEWRRAYRLCLMSIPIFVACIWAAFWGMPALQEDTVLFWRISQHAGGGILSGISSHVLVATHVFLETIHYAVWLVIIPLVDRRAIPWRLETVPFFASEGGFPRMVKLVCAVSVVLVIALWAGFSLDYTVTRDVYFAFAIAHVLAEFPFLIKML